MNTTFISRFTPSLLTQDALEAVFVQRENLASRVVDLVRQSVLSKNKHYVLLVGPRGIGKTHFISLIYHRVRNETEIASRITIAWLREEEWGVTSFLDFLL